MLDFTPLIIFGSIALCFLSLSILIYSVAKFQSIQLDIELKKFKLNRLKYGKKD